jgi:hypothetical protein
MGSTWCPHWPLCSRRRPPRSHSRRPHHRWRPRFSHPQRYHYLLASRDRTSAGIDPSSIAVGILHGLAALDTPEQRLGRSVVATVEIIAGIVVVSSPNIGYATLASLVGLSFIANGIAMIVFGILLRTLKRDGRRVDVAAVT